VKIAFYVIAAVMIAAALALLLVPMVLQGRRSGASRGVFALVLAIAFALPLATIGLYFLVGTPMALNGVLAEAQPTLTMQQAVTELHAHLAKEPGDVQAWQLLAQTSALQHKPADARDAYGHVLKLDPNNADAMVGWAENDSVLRSDHMIEGRALTLLKRAVLLQPNSQRGLWLLGIGNFQHGQYREAAATWRLLQPQLEPGSKVAKAIAEQIAIADKRAASEPASASSSNSTPGAAAPTASLQVHVTLAPALTSKLRAGDTLYVYARAPQGPPIPLAVAKLAASQLPITVTLDDAMAMRPTFNLSSVREVFVGARISHSGQPIAQPGDLEGNAGVVAVDSKAPVNIRIDKVH
jgi:cytochrome c-type biogenesis protein CcmH